MLFDLRGRGRRRTVKLIYVSLALLMGGGLILFGIGGATSGGLLDALQNNGGTSSTKAFEKTIQRAQTRARLHPRDPAAWAALTRAEYQMAGVGDNYDQATSTFTAKGRVQLRKAAAAWDRYVALAKNPDSGLAAQMVQAFGPAGLNQPAQAVSAQEAVIAAQPPSTGLYGRLAILAYAAGQTRKGDLASAKAVSLAPKDQRPALRDTLKQAKQSPQAALGGTG